MLPRRPLKLAIDAAELFLSGRSFEGCADVTACSFDRFQAAFQTKNQRLIYLIAKLRQDHQSSLWSVAEINRLLAAGDCPAPERGRTGTAQVRHHRVSVSGDGQTLEPGQSRSPYLG